MPNNDSLLSAHADNIRYFIRMDYLLAGQTITVTSAIFYRRESNEKLLEVASNDSEFNSLYTRNSKVST